MFSNFEDGCDFGEFDLSVVLEDSMKSHILYLFESLAYQLADLLFLNNRIFTVLLRDGREQIWNSLWKEELSFCFSRL